MKKYRIYSHAWGSLRHIKGRWRFDHGGSVYRVYRSYDNLDAAVRAVLELKDMESSWQLLVISFDKDNKRSRIEYYDGN